MSCVRKRNFFCTVADCKCKYYIYLFFAFIFVLVWITPNVDIISKFRFKVCKERAKHLCRANLLLLNTWCFDSVKIVYKVICFLKKKQLQTWFSWLIARASVVHKFVHEKVSFCLGFKNASILVDHSNTVLGPLAGALDDRNSTSLLSRAMEYKRS